MYSPLLPSFFPSGQTSLSMLGGHSQNHMRSVVSHGSCLYKTSRVVAERAIHERQLPLASPHALGALP